jgi:uncharacterized membrane protein YbaN (DUF454 family)
MTLVAKVLMKKFILLIAGHFFLILGIVGAFLPILPTTPFLLLAALCYSRTNSFLYSWLRNQKYLGPPLRDWEEKKVIGLKAKILATLMISLVIIFRLPYLAVPLWPKILMVLILSAVLLFIWTRPSSIDG